MASRESPFVEITPEVLLKAYSCGIFPMADSADDPGLHWIEPPMRGIIPLEGFHISSRLARSIGSSSAAAGGRTSTMFLCLRMRFVVACGDRVR